METYGRFLFEFLNQFFSGFKEIFSGLISGIQKIFNIGGYTEIIQYYKNDFSIPEWVLVALAIFALVFVVGAVAALIIMAVVRHSRWKKKLMNQEELLEEIDALNNQVESLIEEKLKILDMKNPELGINSDIPGEPNPMTVGPDGKPIDGEEITEDSGESRFSKLKMLDEEYANYKQKDYKNSFTLPEFCHDFRHFAASQLGLYYSEKMIRLFVSAIASTKLVILQGISGTGKTSISLAWGKYVSHPSCVASVQPSWRDRTDIFGYLNEFTKKFNETDFLSYLYEAGYTDEVWTVILDEMNLARVEYYFAEMLSILEMHNTDEWKIEVVQSSWKSDPKKLKKGKLQIPPNTWYIGTINNDDSTFMVTDKVYDRAMPIDINEKGTPFEPEPTEAKNVNYSYLRGLFDRAIKDNAMSKDILDKIEKMDDYTIKHFRVAFGNRIVKHMKSFVPVYVACGGDEIEAVDYFMAKKVLRKFEALNLALIRDEIDGYVKFLDDNFGKGRMAECIEFLLRLKKMA